MKKDYTHIGIVLDASGSMSDIENDIKGSFNSFLNKQKEEKGQTIFDLFQFSNEVEHLVKACDLALFNDDLMAKYTCSGCTALNDAVCTAIDTMGKKFADMPEEERPENVICVIITDGFENASVKFSSKDVKERILHQQDVYKWNFVFLAANQDAFQAGSQLGINEKYCYDFSTDSHGVKNMVKSMACCISNIRLNDAPQDILKKTTKKRFKFF